MKRGLGLVALGLLALVAQGSLATLIPPPYCPDFALLVVIGIGLRWRNLAGGLCIAALLGYGADLLSGSLLGQHTLLRLFAFAGARLASRQLNLRGALPLAIFAGAATVLYHVGLAALSSFFAGEADLGWAWAGTLIQHAVANAIVAPATSLAVEKVAGWLGDEEASRRMRLQPRERVA